MKVIETLPKTETYALGTQLRRFVRDLWVLRANRRPVFLSSLSSLLSSLSSLLLIIFLFSPATALSIKNKISVDLYVMSLCPYGIQAEAGLFPAVQALPKNVNLKIFFIANEDLGKNPRFTSLHGQPEVLENMRQVAINELYPKKLLPYILERNKNLKSSWEESARKTGIDPKRIEKFVESDKGRELYSENLKAAKSNQVNSSPTLFIDGKKYAGSRSAKAFGKTLCESLGLDFEKTLPAIASMKEETPAAGHCNPEIASTPTHLPFDLYVLVDSSCSFCKPHIAEYVKKLHLGATLQTVEYTSALGKSLLEQTGMNYLPLYIFPKKIEEDPNFEKMKFLYKKTGDWYVLNSGRGSYVPSVQLGRPKSAKHLDLFVDASLEYTAPALLDLFRRLDETGPAELTFTVHFTTQFHMGAPESDAKKALDENLRQACLFQKSGIKAYVNYLRCLQDSKENPEKCSDPNPATKECIEGPEGPQLLEQQAVFARSVGVEFTPMLLWENHYGPFQWYQVDLKTLLSKTGDGHGSENN